jgi:phosphoserine phosphatase RsbU/P
MGRFVVLVDDEEGILKVLQRELKSWAGDRELEIRSFTRGEDALKFLAENHLDVILVISDQRMPGVKGHELLATCSQRYPGILLLMLTGYADVQDITKAIRSGITSFILKPWDHDDLIYEITKAYNLYELRVRNRRYLQLIKNELSLAAILRETVARDGDYDYGWCGVGYRQRVSPEQNLSGVDVMQHIPVGPDHLMLFSCRIDSDGVRGSMVGGAILLRIFSIMLERTDCSDYDIASLSAEIGAIVGVIEREIPTVIVRYTLAVLRRRELTIEYTGNGYAPWLVVRGGEYGEITVEENGMGRVATSRVGNSDTIVIASPGVLEKMTDPAETNTVRTLARRVREAGDRESLAARVDYVLDLVQSHQDQDQPMDLALMIVRVNEEG